MIKKLPNGWIIKKLGGKDGVAEIVNGATPSTDEPSCWGGTILWATPTDMGKLDSMYITDTERKITKVGYDSCSTTLVPAYSILMTSRAPVGNMAINTVPICTNQGFKSIVLKGNVDVYYLFYFIKSIIAQIQKDSHGNTFTEIGKEKVEDIDVPLPKTIEEQKRISKNIMEKFEKANKLQRAAQKQFEAAEALPNSVLREVFNFKLL